MYAVMGGSLVIKLVASELVHQCNVHLTKEYLGITNIGHNVPFFLISVVLISATRSGGINKNIQIYLKYIFFIL